MGYVSGSRTHKNNQLFLIIIRKVLQKIGSGKNFYSDCV